MISYLLWQAKAFWQECNVLNVQQEKKRQRRVLVKTIPETVTQEPEPVHDAPVDITEVLPGPSASAVISTSKGNPFVQSAQCFMIADTIWVNSEHLELSYPTTAEVTYRFKCERNIRNVVNIIILLYYREERSEESWANLQNTQVPAESQYTQQNHCTATQEECRSSGDHQNLREREAPRRKPCCNHRLRPWRADQKWKDQQTQEDEKDLYSKSKDICFHAVLLFASSLPIPEN